MVAGMVMPLDNLKAIYEHLFRDGVMVAKKDKRPQTKHPEIPSVDNLQVIRAMGSLKSRGYVRETFAWRHYYWYLTNEGIVYLRDYLHLPPEIVPTPLQRVRRPAATLAIARRAEHVQAVQGPTSYVPKPGKMGAEKQEALLDRQEYRRKMASMDEAEMIESRERTPRFRGHPMASTQIKPKGSWEFKEQPMLSDTRDYTKEMEPSVRRKVAVHSVCHMPPIETYHAKPVEQEKMVERKECTKTAFVQKTQTVNVSPDVATISSKVGGTATESTSTATGESKMAKDARHPPPSKPKVEKKQKALVTKNVQDVPAVSSVERTIAVESSLYSVHTKAVKEKPKEEVLKVVQQTTSTVTAKDAPRPTPSKPKVEETQKTTVAKNVQDVSSTAGATSGESSVSSVPAEAAKEKPKEEVFIKVSKKTTSTVADNSKMAEDALHPTPAELKVKKTQQSLMSKDVQDVSAVSSAVESSVSTEEVKEKPKEEVCVSVSQETTPKSDSKIDKDAIRPTQSKSKLEKTQQAPATENVQDVPIVSSAVETTAVKSSVSTEAVKEKAKEEVYIKVSQTTSTGDSKREKDALHLTASKTKVEKTTKTKNVQDISNVLSTAVESSVFPVSAEAVKEKPTEEVFMKVSQETTFAVTGDSKMVKDAPHPTLSKPKVEKTQKTRNVQDVPAVSSVVETTAVKSSTSTEAEKEKPKEEMRVSVSQEIKSKGDSKEDKNAPRPTPSKPKVEKMQKTTKTKNVQDIQTVLSRVEATAMESSVLSVSTEAVKEKPKEELRINVAVETTSTSDSKTPKDAPHSSPLKPKVEKTQKTMLTKNVQEQPIKNEKADVTNETYIAVHADETKSSTSISAQVSVKSVESAMPLLPKKDEDLAIHIAEKKSEINLPLHTPELSVEETAVPPIASSTVQMIDKQQRALGSQKTKEVQEASKDDNTSPLKVHEKVEIPSQRWYIH